MAIPTLYRGVEYRSRLEAKWAGFFHRLGWEFTYEPFDGDGYIPDFLIHGEIPFLAEVKPAVTLEDYKAATQKMEQGLLRHWAARRMVVLGVSPLPRIKAGYDSPVAGLLCDNLGDEEGNWWDQAIWNSDSPEPGLSGEYGSYACSPHGYYDGNNIGLHNPVPAIEAAWAGATNDVKWRAKSA